MPSIPPAAAHIPPKEYKILLSVDVLTVIRAMTVAPAAIPTANPVLTAIPITITAKIIFVKLIIF